MLLNIKSKQEIIKEIIEYIKSRYPLADVVPGTVLRDLHIEGPATYFYETYTIVAFLEKILDLSVLKTLLVNADDKTNLAAVLGTSVSQLERMLTDIVNLYAANYGLTRKPATKASGRITFYALSDSIPNSGILIRAGTICQVPGTNLTFRTLEDAILTKSSNLLNTTTNRYEVSVSAECEIPGSVGNVPANTITSLQSGFSLNVVPINYERFSGGIDEETDVGLLDRLRLVYTGNFHGTADSILSRVLTYPFVEDAKCAYLPEDPNKVTEGLYSIDVFVKSLTSSRFLENVEYKSNYGEYIPLEKPFVSTIYSVKILNNNYIFDPSSYDLYVNSEGKAFVKLNSTYSIYTNYYGSTSNDFFFLAISPQPNGRISITSKNFDIPVERYKVQLKYIDSNGVEYSFDITDFFTINPNNPKNIAANSGTGYNLPDIRTCGYTLVLTILPADGDVIQVDYAYNGTLKTIYDDLNSPLNLFIGQRINVFQAEEVPITIKATVQIDQSYDLSSKSTECLAALSSYLSKLPMGATINITDVIYTLKSVPGVIDVKLPLQELRSPKSITNVSDIVLLNKQYPILSSESKVQTQYGTVVNQWT